MPFLGQKHLRYPSAGWAGPSFDQTVLGHSIKVPADLIFRQVQFTAKLALILTILDKELHQGHEKSEIEIECRQSRVHFVFHPAGQYLRQEAKAFLASSFGPMRVCQTAAPPSLLLFKYLRMQPFASWAQARLPHPKQHSESRTENAPAQSVPRRFKCFSEFIPSL